MAEQQKSSGPAAPEKMDLPPELKKQMAQSRREAVRMGRTFKELEAHPGFKLYKQVLATKIVEMQKLFMRPLEDDRKSLAQEYLKGGINYLLWAHDLASVTVQAAQELAMGAVAENEPDPEDKAMPDTTPPTPLVPPVTNGKGH